MASSSSGASAVRGSDARATPNSRSHSAFGSRSAPEELYHDPHWYACRTRSRAEKQVHRTLRGEGMESYLPLVERERHWADRTKRVEFPLFPGYVFARFPLTDVGRLSRVPGVAKVVDVNGYPSPLREEEIEAVRRLVETAKRTGVEPSPIDFLTPGQEVEVVDGPFEGMRGILVERRGRTRVAVKLSAIRQAVSVELDRHALRPVLEPSRTPSANGRRRNGRR